MTRRRCRVFLAGEGVSDIGHLSRPVGYRDGREGFLQPILRSLVGDAIELEFEGAKMTTLAKTTIKTSNKLFARHAAQAYVLADYEDCKAVVFCCDVDRTRGERSSKVEAKKRIAELQASVERGFADAKTDTADTTIATVIATPCRMIEAWALGDPVSLAAVAGSTIDMAACSNPEQLWGNEDDPLGRHPKRVLARLVGDPPDLPAIATAADCETIERACPMSFAPFANSVRVEFARCSEE